MSVSLSYLEVCSMREMKDSEASWLGMIPTEWELKKINSLYSLRNTKVSDRDYSPLSVTMKGIVPQLENAAKTNAHDDRKLVKKGDFAINSRSDRRGSCGISDMDGSVSLINTVLKPNQEMNPKYYNWLFHTVQFADEFYANGHGIVNDLWTTTWQDMKKILTPSPPIEEQQRIANFLDEKCSEIDSLAKNIEKQIGTLEVYKKSIITEAVTKGLDPNVVMKDSGIEGVNEIPSHWQVKRAKYICESLFKGNGITKDDIKDDGDICCIRYGEIYSKYNGAVTAPTTSTNISLVTSPKHIKKGDLLFAGTGELIEEIGKNIVYMGNSPCLAGGDIIIMRHSQNPIFLNYTMNSVLTQIQKSKGKAKLKVVHISATDIGNLFVAMPPLEEQQQIADYLDSKCSEIDAIIQTKKEQLDVLAEYKKSLIYEYVTGKKEVPVNE